MNSLKNNLILFLILFVSTLMAQESLFSTIKVDDGVYLDETEIDVASWLSFYTWTIVHEGFGEAQKFLPDSNAIEPELWNYIKKKSTDFINFDARYTQLPVGYFDKECVVESELAERLPNFRNRCSLLDFPITGVSYEQAIAFCKWRTKMLGDSKIEFRLPTPEEWKNFALNDLSKTEQKKGIRDSLNNKDCAVFNYSIPCNNGIAEKQGNLKGVAMYSPSTIGVYDIFGNVSEMTSLKGVSKGGNFRLYANLCHIDSVQHYTEPEIWLGFRCIAVEISEYKSANTVSIKDSGAVAKYDKFIDFRDNKTYPTVLIGDQIWFASNLAFKPDSGKYWSWNNEEKYVEQYGYLYTWETAKNVCSVGWHLPSKEEFEILLENVGGNETKAAYEALLPSGSSGYSIVFAGLRKGLNFAPIGLGGHFWSSTENSKRVAWGFGIGTGIQKASIQPAFSKNDGLSIRCIKDQ